MARAAGLVHPMDWVRIYEAHNEYEWALQVALSHVDSWGDDRADLRAAVVAAKSVAHTQGGKFSEEQMSDLIRTFNAYLWIHDPQKFREQDRPTLKKISDDVSRRIAEQSQEQAQQQVQGGAGNVNW